MISNFTSTIIKLWRWDSSRSRRLLMKLVAKLIKISLPTQEWYQAAFTFTKYYTERTYSLKGKSKKSFRMNQALHLETLLMNLSIGDKFPAVFDIPISVLGDELIKSNRRNGLLICSIHLPLNLVAVRWLVEQGLVPDAIIAKYPPEDGYLHVSGTTTRIPTISPGANVLIKVRGILRRGGIVIALIDRNLQEGNFSPNILHLAEKINADVLFALTELQLDGSVEASIFECPNTNSLEEGNVNIKINTLRDYVKKLIH